MESLIFTMLKFEDFLEKQRFSNDEDAVVQNNRPYGESIAHQNDSVAAQIFDQEMLHVKTFRLQWPLAMNSCIR